MGHMNCLDRLKRESKSGREHRETFFNTLEFFMLAMAIELHNEKDPYGKERCERVGNGIKKRAMAYIDRYGDEFTLTAMRKECKEFGFEVQIK